jgi:pimeloyl-ACP methyl ester carboxylesterase
MALTLYPKVRALVLMASPLPHDVDMADLNLLVVALYGQKDSVVTPFTVENSFSRFPGDSQVTSFPNLGHYDFARSECAGNNRSSEERHRLDVTSDFDTIVSLASSAVGLSRWMGATEKALSFSDNEKLKPGHNDSKPYPGDIRVQYSKIPMPDTSPQRYWYVFTPSEIKGGFVYYPGAAVDAQAYFPMAFQIAARGHLVVIVQMPMRAASFRYQDANAVIASDHPLLSVVPKGKWALGGHSAGGYAATQYAGEYSDNIYAVVMHAGGWGSNLTSNSLPIKQIYGTLDGISPGGFDRYRYRNTDPPPKGNGPLVNLSTTVFLPVEGANHCQSGDYGYQSFDGIATISMEHQVRTFAEETASFLDHVASGKPIAQHRLESM